MWFDTISYKQQHSFEGLFSSTTCISQHRKSKPFLVLVKQETTGWQWHQMDHMEIICILLQRDKYASITTWISFHRPNALFDAQQCPSKLNKNVKISQRNSGCNPSAGFQSQKMLSYQMGTVWHSASCMSHSLCKNMQWLTTVNKVLQNSQKISKDLNKLQQTSSVAKNHNTQQWAMRDGWTDITTSHHILSHGKKYIDDITQVTHGERWQMHRWTGNRGRCWHCTVSLEGHLYRHHSSCIHSPMSARRQLYSSLEAGCPLHNTQSTINQLTS